MSKQLVNIINNNFKIPISYSLLDKEINSNEVSDIPFTRWPNRMPCFEVNLYIISQLREGRSRRVKGGTLRTYAYNISHLIHFCYKNNINFSSLNDNYFTLFINNLIMDKDGLGQKIRSNNQVNTIGRQCINFLFYFSFIYDLEDFIGEGIKFKIKVKELKYHKTMEGRKPLILYYWSHPSFPSKNPLTKNTPISYNALTLIKETIRCNCNPGLVKRNLLLIQSYEQSGARRTEALLLRIKDVRTAFDSPSQAPKLRFETLKRKGHHERFIPVPHTFLDNLMDYITTTRRKIIRNTIGISNDHGYVFISHTNGMQLNSNTISTYMTKWRHSAGIEDKAFVHLIRHLFITEKLKCIIIEHNFTNKDSLRDALLNIERFKMMLREWTGHTLLSSLDAYINLAFNELEGVRETYNALSLKSSVEVTKDRIATFKEEVSNKGSKKNNDQLLKIIASFEEDLNNSINN